MPSKTTHAKSAAGKSISITLLAIAAVVILVLGAAFTVYSLLTDVTFPVFGTPVSGTILGLMVAWLGLRNIQAVRKLKQELGQSTAPFSWQNFRKTPSIR